MKDMNETKGVKSKSGRLTDIIVFILLNAYQKLNILLIVISSYLLITNLVKLVLLK